MRSAGFALGLALVAIPALASAQTQLLVGSKFVIKNPRQGDEANKMVFMSKHLSVATPVSTDVNWKGGVAGTRWKYRGPSGATS